MKEKREHPTLTMKVKAPIDVLVAPLVRALSRYPEVMTMYSCQGEPLTNAQKWNFQTDAAFVIFSIGTGSTLELASFLDFMSDHVHLLDCHARTSISMPTGVSAQLEFRTQQENLPKCAKWFRRIRKHWDGLDTELRDRTSASRVALAKNNSGQGGALDVIPIGRFPTPPEKDSP